jgi:hypothetical protein
VNLVQSNIDVLAVAESIVYKRTKRNKWGGYSGVTVDVFKQQNKH